MRIYIRALIDLPPAEVAAACAVLVGRTDFLPSIAAIRREVVERRLGLPSPVEAWESLQTRESRAVATPVARRALDALGGSYSMRTSENPDIFRAQFLKAYAELRELAVREESERSAGLAIDRAAAVAAIGAGS